MANKDLKTASVLTITTGIAMVERFDGVGEAFEWIMGHPVWTHEMPQLGDEAKARVLLQYPEFPTEADGQNWRSVLAETLGKYGETIKIEEGTANRQADPITTLAAAIF